MSTTVKPSYVGETTYTINPDGLASAGARQGAVIDNTSLLYDDFGISGQFQTATGTLGTNPRVQIWIAPISVGTNYTDAVASSGDAGYTILATPNIRLVGICNINTANTTAYMGEVFLSALFGGSLPDKFVLIVDNQTGLALSGTAGQNTNNKVSYRGLQFISV